MKVAHLVAQERGAAIGARDVVAMATINGARILKWDRHLGSVEPGRLADLMVVNGRGGDPYEHPPPAPPDVSSPQLTSSPPRKGKAISGIHRPALDVTGTVPGIDEAVFQEAAEQAKENCPVSKALQGNVELTVTPRLGS